MEEMQSLPLLTWVVLLGPMPLVLAFAVVDYFRAQRQKRQ